MEQDRIGNLSRSLPLSPRRRRAIERELRSHLAEAQRDLELSGWKPEDAARESMERLGDPKDIAEGFTQVYRRPSRTKIGAAFALTATLLIGAYGASGTLASSTSAHRHPARAHPQHPAPHPRSHR